MGTSRLAPPRRGPCRAGPAQSHIVGGQRVVDRAQQEPRSVRPAFQLDAEPSRNITRAPAKVKPEQHVSGKRGRKTATTVAQIAQVPIQVLLSESVDVEPWVRAGPPDRQGFLRLRHAHLQTVSGWPTLLVERPEQMDRRAKVRGWPPADDVSAPARPISDAPNSGPIRTPERALRAPSVLQLPRLRPRTDGPLGRPAPLIA
jgi:hypothetical protein